MSDIFELLFDEDRRQECYQRFLPTGGISFLLTILAGAIVKGLQQSLISFFLFDIAFFILLSIILVIMMFSIVVLGIGLYKYHKYHEA